MPQTRRKRRRTWPAPVLERITELLAAGETPAKIEEQLKHDKKLKEYREAEKIPGQRTIYDLRRELFPGPASGMWSLIDDDVDEAALILPVLREMNRPGSGGFLGWNVPKPLAHWIFRVRTADPEIPLREAFYQALRYLQAEGGLSEPAAADEYLVLQKWQGHETGRGPRLFNPEPTRKEPRS